MPTIMPPTHTHSHGSNRSTLPATVAPRLPRPSAADVSFALPCLLLMSLPWSRWRRVPAPSRGPAASAASRISFARTTFSPVRPGTTPGLARASSPCKQHGRQATPCAQHALCAKQGHAAMAFAVSLLQSPCEQHGRTPVQLPSLSSRMRSVRSSKSVNRAWSDPSSWAIRTCVLCAPTAETAR